jgi:hypothetical protein
MNTLAGHIYRNIRFNVYTEPSITTSNINRDLMRMRPAASTSGAGFPRPSSKPNSDGLHRLQIILQRPATTTSEPGARRQSLHSTGGERSSEIGGLDSAKQGENVFRISEAVDSQNVTLLRAIKLVPLGSAAQ